MLCQQNLRVRKNAGGLTQQKRAVSVKIVIFGLKMAKEGKNMLYQQKI